MFLIKVIRNNKKYHLLSILLIVAVCIIIYANTFKNEFMFDDMRLIVENYRIRALSNIPHFPLIQQPIREITFALDYHFWGLRPFGYHLTNLILHIFCSILVYFFLLNLSAPRNQVPRPPPAFQFSLIAALLFAAHPIHTDAVTAMSNRKELLVMLFIMLSILLYIKSKPYSKMQIVFYIGSIVSFLLALGSKLVALTLPFLLIIYEYYTSSGDDYSQKEQSSKRLLTLRLTPYFLIIFSCTIYACLNYEQIFWMAKQIGLSAEEYFGVILTTFKAFGIYIRLLILPYNMCAEYVTTLSYSILEISTFIPICLFCFLLFIMIKLWNTKHKYLSFGLAWFFINLLPVSNLIPANYIVAERYMYVPSLGFCVILAYGLCLLFKSNPAKVGISLAIILFTYSTFTILRNTEWRDAYTFWSKTVKQSPKSPIAHNNLGNVYAQMKMYDRALLEYEKAVQINPEFEDAYFNIVLVNVREGAIDKAESLGRLYLNTGKIKSKHMLARIYLLCADVLIKRGQYDRAMKFLNDTQNFQPDNPIIYGNIGYIYVMKGEYEKAELFYRKALSLDPQFVKAYMDLGNICLKRQSYEEAISLYRTALNFDKNCIQAYYNLGLSYEALGNIKEAIYHYSEFLEYWKGEPALSEAAKRGVARLVSHRP